MSASQSVLPLRLGQEGGVVRVVRPAVAQTLARRKRGPEALQRLVAARMFMCPVSVCALLRSEVVQPPSSHGVAWCVRLYPGLTLVH